MSLSRLWTAAALLAGFVIAGRAPAAGADAQSSVVEDFTYPGAEQIFQEHGIRVIRGDGHIRFVPSCASGGDLIQVESLEGSDGKLYCFEIRGQRGFVTVDIPHVYLIRGASKPVVATATYEGETETVTVPPNTYEPIGGGDATHTLVELRLPGGTSEPSPAGQHPFMAKIDTAGRGCSGVLVAANWVATAKTCFAADGNVVAGPPPQPTTVIVGRADLQRTGGYEADVVELVPRADRDFTLAKLATPVTGIAPIGLARRTPAVGDTMSAAGYGRTASDWTNDRVHVGAFTVAATSATTMELRRSTGTATSTCAGDAGGPAFRQIDGQFELFAVHSTSWQTGCFGVTEQRDAAIEARADDIAAWITEQTGPRPYSWKNAHTSRCLADSFGGGLQVLACAAPPNQVWRDTSLIPSVHQFKNEHTGRCLADSFGGGLQVLPCDAPATTQKWQNVSPTAPPYQFKNQHTGRCLADSFGGGLQVLPCDTPATQKWQKP